MPAQLPPIVMQVVGILLLILAAVFWAVTGKQSAEFISAALSLIAGGGWLSAVRKKDT